MKIRKILVPTDFSETSNAAIRFATPLARDWHATLLILHVHESPAEHYLYAGGIVSHSVPTAELQRLLDRFRPLDPEVGFSQHVAYGDPADQILRYAAETESEMIVMGTHNHRGITKWLTGSVTATVLRHATIPVATVKLSPERVPESQPLHQAVVMPPVT